MILDGVEDEVEVSVCEEDASADEVVCGFVGEFFNALDHFFGDVVAAEFVDQFLIVYLFARCAGDGVGIDNEILIFLFCFCLFDLGFLNGLLFFLFDGLLILLFC
jgi:hypothetical protein